MTSSWAGLKFGEGTPNKDILRSRFRRMLKEAGVKEVSILGVRFDVPEEMEKRVFDKMDEEKAGRLLRIAEGKA